MASKLRKIIVYLLSAILMIVILVLILYYSWSAFKNLTNNFVEQNIGSSLEQKNFLEKTITGTVTNISGNDVYVQSLYGVANQEQWIIKISSRTIYKNISVNDGLFEVAKREDLAIGSSAIFKLSGKNSARALTAIEVILL